MVSQGREYTHGCFKSAEYIFISIHFCRPVVDQISGKQYQIGFEIQNPSERLFQLLFYYQNFPNEYPKSVQFSTPKAGGRL